jgi:hypothetical protein
VSVGGGVLNDSSSSSSSSSLNLNTNVHFFFAITARWSVK